MIDPKFLLVQFNQGAAGKFLMSLLMGSDSVAHFDQAIDGQKNNQTLLEYIHRSFQSFDNWIATEPNPVPAWNIHWISGKMPRGESQPYADFYAQLKTEASTHFWNSVSKEKYILISCNKLTPPLAYTTASKIVIINDHRSLKFLRKSLWYKHYGCKNNQIHLKVNDPELYPIATRNIMKKFDNPIYSDENLYKFYRRTLWNNPTTEFFSNKHNFSSTDIIIELKDILDCNLLVSSLTHICQRLQIKPIDYDYIVGAHAHWMSLHHFNY